MQPKSWKIWNTNNNDNGNNKSNNSSNNKNNNNKWVNGVVLTPKEWGPCPADVGRYNQNCSCLT